MDFAVSVGTGAAQTAAAFVPLPWVAPAVNALCGIIQLCQNVPLNQKAADRLRDRCCLFMVALYDSTKGGPSESIKGAVDEAIATLQSIEKDMKACNKRGFFGSLIHQSQISDTIGLCQQKISDCCTKFMMVANLEVLRTLAKGEAIHERSHQEIVQYLIDIRDAHSVNEVELAARLDAIARVRASEGPGPYTVPIGIQASHIQSRQEQSSSERQQGRVKIGIRNLSEDHIKVTWCDTNGQAKLANDGKTPRFDESIPPDAIRELWVDPHESQRFIMQRGRQVKNVERTFTRDQDFDLALFWM